MIQGSLTDRWLVQVSYLCSTFSYVQTANWLWLVYAWTMGPPLSQKGNSNLMHQSLKTAYSWGRGILQRKPKDFSGEADAELKWAANVHCTEPKSTQYRKVYWCNWKFHFPPGYCSIGLEIRDRLLNSFYLISVLLKVFDVFSAIFENVAWVLTFKVPSSLFVPEWWFLPFVPSLSSCC